MCPKFNPDAQPNIHELAVEEPERQEHGGRDPETFLRKAFDYIKKNVIVFANIEHWLFLVTENFVETRIKTANLPEEFIDKTMEVGEDRNTSLQVFGINELLPLLKGKKVISIKGSIDDGWYLKIVKDSLKKESLQLETPQIPEQKDF